ncbi:hypothetical protein GCM10020220_050950 [Nonomuraea rubra]
MEAPAALAMPNSPASPAASSGCRKYDETCTCAARFEQAGRHVGGGEPVEAAGGGEDGPVVAVHQHHGHGRGHTGVDDAGGDVHAAAAQGVQDEGARGVVAHPPDERGAQAQPAAPYAVIAPEPPSTRPAAGTSCSRWPNSGWRGEPDTITSGLASPATRRSKVVLDTTAQSQEL